MDTSGTSAASVVLELVLLAASVNVALRLPAVRRVRPFPWFAAAAVVVIGAPSIAQHAWPSLGDALARRPELTLEHGQWWRVLTAVLAQDGGLGTALFSLLVVAFAAFVGQRVWGWWRAGAVMLAASVFVNLLALAWDAPGGGSSFACDGLLASVGAAAALRAANPVARVCGGIVVLVGAAQLAAGDGHGCAVLFGAAAGLLLLAGRRTGARLR
ncbi:hypothetical protein [Gryllotalpicola ginsengisoli]|uniref:hypothetical protein n=1 Tax=Gryllotalpicola ginsengisoli TaxID=444608 RepID=UPI0003B74065|nr:hypothetical protein [Gryllotalpicola ginsengisoli]